MKMKTYIIFKLLFLNIRKKLLIFIIMENIEETVNNEILNKITKLENKYIEMKKEFKEIKERFAKL